MNFLNTVNAFFNSYLFYYSGLIFWLFYFLVLVFLMFRRSGILYKKDISEKELVSQVESLISNSIYLDQRFESALVTVRFRSMGHGVRIFDDSQRPDISDEDKPDEV